MNDEDKSKLKKITTKDGKVLYINVVKELCIGAGSCEALAPLTFGLDDKGIAFLIENSNYDTLEDIMAGAQSCPVFAILIYDEDYNQLWPLV